MCPRPGVAPYSTDPVTGAPVCHAMTTEDEVTVRIYGWRVSAGWARAIQGSTMRERRNVGTHLMALRGICITGIGGIAISPRAWYTGCSNDLDADHRASWNRAPHHPGGDAVDLDGRI